MNHSDPISITRRSSFKIYTQRPETNCHAARKAWDMAATKAPANPPVKMHLTDGLWLVTHQDRSVTTIFHTASLARTWKKKTEAPAQPIDTGVTNDHHVP